MVCSSIGRWRVLAAFILWLTPVVAFAESVTVEWDPSEGATGYTVRWGTALGSYPNTADAGPSTQFTIAGLVPGTMYWAVAQAYNATEVSEYSSPLQFTVPGGTLPCSYSISPAGTSISAVGVSGAIVVATQAGCSWSATSSSGFLTFQNGAGRTGSGSVTFAVSANTASSARTGTAIVAGKGFTVSQAAAAPQSCSYSISPANTSAPAAPSAGMIAVTTQEGCTWSASSTSSFLSFPNGTGRTGSGSVDFAVARNTSALRILKGIVAGQTFTVYQAAQGCTFSIDPERVSVTAEATGGTITVTTQAGCAWTAKALNAFIAFENGTDRTGPGSVDFTVEANATSSVRTGIAAVAGTTFYVTQAEPEAEAPPPPPEPSPAPWSSDFNGDGKNDLLLQDSIGGGVEAWFLDNANVTGRQSLSHTMDVNWMLVGRADFNTDGKPDLVWQHKTEGWIYLWYMDGTNRISETYPSISRIDDPLWKVVGVGDFNADQRADLLWQHSGDGTLAVWQMNGITVTETVNIVPSGATDPLWKVVGAGDFNVDGNTDLLWRHMGTGSVAAWLMKGVSRIVHAPLSPMVVSDQRWQVGAVTDANGDGTPDIVWEHTDGTIMIWHMNGTSRGTYPVVSASVPVGWHVVGPK